MEIATFSVMAPGSGRLVGLVPGKLVYQCFFLNFIVLA